MSELFVPEASLIELLGSSFRLSVPLIFAALGGLLCERSGVFNVGLEALLLIGAFGAALGAFHTGSPVVGLAVGIACGVLAASCLAVMTVSLGVNQIVAGVALNIFALGIVAYLARIVIGADAATKLLTGFHPVPIPILAGVPLLGPVLFKHDALAYLLYLMVPALWWLLYKTSWGLGIRAVGHNPRAADTAGLSVQAIRYSCVIAGGALAAVGGCYLVLSQVFVFTEHMSAGKGFIALAAIILGRWHPGGAVLACLLFGLSDALQLRLQFSAPEVPYQLFTMLPYVASIAALVLFAGNKVAPQAVGKFYDRESA